MFISVITTIRQPTSSVYKLAFKLSKLGGHLIVVGDSKGPSSYDLSSVKGFKDEQLSFLSLKTQLEGKYELARLMPTKHYSRKNIGYLHAIALGADCIYETDDDNAPLATWGKREEFAESFRIKNVQEQAGPGWVNVYRHFSRSNIWPRGFPLDQIHTAVTTSECPSREWAPIQQGLANGSPDVDAIWRLVLDEEFTFDENDSVTVEPGQWCPFNTQSTWWWPEVYALLYIPSYCSFRMCDIWKSFVAQRCLWELKAGVAFHAPEVHQNRNVHNLMHDFDLEVVGYTKNNEIAGILQDLRLKPGKANISVNLRQCYEALVDKKIFERRELNLVDQWLVDLKKASAKGI